MIAIPFNYRAYGQSIVGSTINGPKKQYKMVSLLGSGSAGAVLEAVVEGQKVAFKMQKEMTLEERNITQIMVAQQQAFNHLIRIQDFFQLNEFYCIVMEFASGGDLYKYIKGKGPDEKEIKTIMRHICLGVQEFHKKGYIHRDLKPENIILTIQDNGDRIWKICDLGVSRLRAQDANVMTQNVGTPYYQAPEVIQSGKYDLKADIFSLGVLLYEIKTGGRLLFNGTTQQAIQEQIIRYCQNQDNIKAQLQQSLFQSKSLNDILLQMLDPNPEKRPGIDKVLEVFKADIVVKNIVPGRCLQPAPIQIQPAPTQIPLPLPSIDKGPQSRSAIRPSQPVVPVPDPQINLNVQNEQLQQQLKQQIIGLQSENQQLKNQLQAINITYNNLKIENQNQTTEISKLQKQIEENIQNHQNQYNQLFQANQTSQLDFQFNIKRLEQQIQETQAIRKKLESETTNLKGQLQQVSQLQNKLQISERERSSLFQQLEVSQQAVQSQKEEIDKVMVREQQLIMLNELTIQTNKVTQQTILNQQISIEKLSKLKGEAIQSLQDKSDQNNYLSKLAEDLKKQITESNNDIKNVKKEFHQQQINNSKLSRENNSIKNEKQVIEQELTLVLQRLQKSINEKNILIQTCQVQIESLQKQNTDLLDRNQKNALLVEQQYSQTETILNPPQSLTSFAIQAEFDNTIDITMLRKSDQRSLDESALKPSLPLDQDCFQSDEQFEQSRNSFVGINQKLLKVQEESDQQQQDIDPRISTQQNQQVAKSQNQMNNIVQKSKLRKMVKQYFNHSSIIPTDNHDEEYKELESNLKYHSQMQLEKKQINQQKYREIGFLAYVFKQYELLKKEQVNKRLIELKKSKIKPEKDVIDKFKESQKNYQECLFNQ